MLTGELRDFGLTEILQLINTGAKTGTLQVESKGRVARMTFERGRIAYARLNPGVNLGEILQSLGYLSADELKDLLHRQHQGDPTPLGLMALGSGLITDQQLAQAVRRQTETTVYEILRWTRGRFEFDEQDPGSTAIPMAQTLDVIPLILEGSRQQDEWTRIKGAVKPGQIYAYTELNLSSLNLAPAEWRVLTEVDGQTDVRTVAARAGLPEFEVYRAIYVLASMGAIRKFEFRVDTPHVLLVGASAALGQILELGLKPTRYSVVSAETGADCLRLVDADRPSLLVIDADLAGQPWRGLVGALRKNPRTAYLPIIVLGGRAGLLDGFARGSGPLTTLPKPVDPDQLTRKVRQVLGVEA